MAQDSSVYDFTLFDSLDYGSAVPELEPEYEPREEPRKRASRPAEKKRPAKRKRTSRTVSSKQRAATRVSAFNALRVLLVVVFIFALICLPMYLNVKLDETSKEISAVQNDIDVAISENVRLKYELNARVSIDKVKDYAEKELGMVKVENYRITYFDSDDGDRVVVSGGKTYRSDD